MFAVGIDVSKGKSTVAVKRLTGEVVCNPFDVSHTAKNLKCLIELIKSLPGESKAVMEATGNYHEPIAKALRDAGIFVRVVNAYQIKRFDVGELRRAKTDKKDALKIADYVIHYWSSLFENEPADDIRRDLKLLNRQYHLNIKLQSAFRTNLVSQLELVFPNINRQFTSPERESDGHEKWIVLALNLRGLGLTYLWQSVTVKPFDRATGVMPRPSMILFDALDGQVHSNVNEIKDMVYFEYGEIWFDGSTIVSGARKMQTNTIDEGSGKPDEYRIETARVKDHAIIRIIGEKQTNEVIIALPDSTRFAYIALTGEHCCLTDISTETTETEVEIPRIAEEISYINLPAGDVPNVQVNGHRTAASEGIPVEDGMEISFHAMSLPTARLVWHCPFLNVFGADDGKVYGENYRDYMLVRLDGECWEGDPGCTVTAEHSRSDDFTSWDDWKERSKAGFDCTFTFERKGNLITVRTENGGVVIKSTAEITDGNETIYAAITGDQVAVTNIRIYSPQA